MSYDSGDDLYGDDITSGPYDNSFEVRDRTLELTRNRNGTSFCEDCRRIVILFDDDTHECNGIPWYDEPRERQP